MAIDTHERKIGKKFFWFFLSMSEEAGLSLAYAKVKVVREISLDTPYPRVKLEKIMIQKLERRHSKEGDEIDVDNNQLFINEKEALTKARKRNFKSIIKGAFEW